MRISKIVFTLLLIAVGIFSSCKSDKPKTEEKPTDNMTKGEITIGVDDNLQPIIEAELETFHHVYDKAHINALYKPENQCFEDLLNGKVRLIVAGRNLTADESAIFQQQKISPDISKVATDAVALLVNTENADTQMTRAQLRSILSGEISTWQQLNSSSAIMENGGKITIVVDNGGSGALRYLMDNVLQSQAVPQNLFSANSNQGVIDYVGQNKGAIGLIGLNWVSDRDEASVGDALSKTTLVAMEAEDSLGQGTGKFFQPYQSYIADGSYPLRRDVLMISREARAGLGTGFVAFVAGEKGQRVMLKSGLYPEFMPPRLVKFPSKDNAKDIDEFIKEKAKEKDEDETQN